MAVCFTLIGPGNITMVLFGINTILSMLNPKMISLRYLASDNP